VAWMQWPVEIVWNRPAHLRLSPCSWLQCWVTSSSLPTGLLSSRLLVGRASTWAWKSWTLSAPV
jgi:hypothetical protein